MLQLGQTWEVVAWEIVYIWEVASWENSLVKVPLEKKYPWEVATWEKSFWKVSNKRYFTPRRSLLKRKKIRDQLINLDEMR